MTWAVLSAPSGKVRCAGMLDAAGPRKPNGPEAEEHVEQVERHPLRQAVGQLVEIPDVGQCATAVR